MLFRRAICVAVGLLCVVIALAVRDEVAAEDQETLPEITARLAKETSEAYESCRYSTLSKDYFARFSRDPNAVANADEVVIGANWKIVVVANDKSLAALMAGHLRDFLRDRMGAEIEVVQGDAGVVDHVPPRVILLRDNGRTSGNASSETFMIHVERDRAIVQGNSPAGLRDGVVRFVDRIGFRQAPMLKIGETTYQPRVPVRLGAVPVGGTIKDVAFMGFNAVLCGGGDLFALSQSNAVPELAARRVPGMLESQRTNFAKIGQYGLKPYTWLNTRQKFPKDDPVFLSHPEIRGALTWAADGEYTLCTSHPLVRQYLKETVQGLFKSLPELHGVVLIIGGEGFYHCHMRPFGAEKGHTNCARCEALGAEAAVADLCNDLASAAREVRPNAEIVLWPYSAEHVWAADAPAKGFLEKLKPGTALLTEIEKSETISKGRGVQKSIWDYSIDFIGPATRTKQQIAICEKRGIPVYVKSEPELAFEAPLLPQLPCMDRWADRAEILATCGARGAWVFPAFRGVYGATTTEVNKYFWWTPVPEREELLHDFARRIAGVRAADKLREAWRETSAAIERSPELPSYYVGPYYMGPMQPMCANLNRPLPPAFYGKFLFHAEIKDAEGLKDEPTFLTHPSGNGSLLGEFYKEMRDHLARASAAVREVSPLVDERHRLMFDAEATAIEWLYCTARTQANFCESCALRDAIVAVADKPKPTPETLADAKRKLARWRDVLSDELVNSRQALPLLKGDMRLDPYYGADHMFAHGEDTLRAKIEILEWEISSYLLSLEMKLHP